MRDLHIIAVGKNTDNNSLSMEAEYLKRIKWNQNKNMACASLQKSEKMLQKKTVLNTKP